MGTTNGVSRGQLRPYLTGRTPPFLVVGLLVVLGILGFSYWSLNTQYNELQIELQKLQDRLRIHAENRETAEKQNSALQSQLQTSQDSEGKCKIVSDKKQQELNQLSEHIKYYENESKKTVSVIETSKFNLEKCEAANIQKDTEIKSLNDKISILDIEKSQLKEQMERLTLFESKGPKSIPENEINVKKSGDNTLLVAQINSSGNEIKEKTNGDVNLDPDVGIPPENREVREIKTTEKPIVEKTIDRLPINFQPINVTREQDNVAKTESVP